MHLSLRILSFFIIERFLFWIYTCTLYRCKRYSSGIANVSRKTFQRTKLVELCIRFTQRHWHRVPWHSSFRRYGNFIYKLGSCAVLVSQPLVPFPSTPQTYKMIRVHKQTTTFSSLFFLLSFKEGHNFQPTYYTSFATLNLQFLLGFHLKYFFFFLF